MTWNYELWQSPTQKGTSSQSSAGVGLLNDIEWSGENIRVVYMLLNSGWNLGLYANRPILTRIWNGPIPRVQSIVLPKNCIMPFQGKAFNHSSYFHLDLDGSLFKDV